MNRGFITLSSACYVLTVLCSGNSKTKIRIRIKRNLRLKIYGKIRNGRLKLDVVSFQHHVGKGCPVYVLLDMRLSFHELLAPPPPPKWENVHNSKQNSTRSMLTHSDVKRCTEGTAIIQTQQHRNTSQNYVT